MFSGKTIYDNNSDNDDDDEKVFNSLNCLL